MKNYRGSDHGLVRRSKERQNVGRHENRRGKEKKNALLTNAVLSAPLTT